VVDDGKAAKERTSQLIRYDLDTGSGRAFSLSGTIYCLAVAQDGNHVLVGMPDQTSYLTLEPPEVEKTLSGSFSGIGQHPLLGWYPVISVAFSDDDSHAVVGCADSVLEKWDLSSGTQIHSEKEHRAGIRAVRFLRGSTDAAAYACGDGTVRFVGSNEPVRHGHRDPVNCLDISQDGQWAVSGGDDGTLRLWPLGAADREMLKVKGVDLTKRIEFSPDDRLIAFVPLVGSGVTLVDATTGATLTTAELPHEIEDAVFTDEPGHLLVAGEDGSLVLWDVLAAKPARVYAGHPPHITTLDYSLASRSFAVGTKDGVLAWMAVGGEQLAPHQFAAGEVKQVRMFNRGQNLVALQEGSLSVWEIARGLRWSTPSSELADAETIAVSPDGKLIATGHQDMAARLWDARTGQPRQVLRGHQNTVTGLAFSQDGRVLLTASFDGWIHVWNTGTGTELGAFGRMPVTGLALSSDGCVATSVMGDHNYYGDVDAVLWDASRADRHFKGPPSSAVACGSSADSNPDIERQSILGEWFAFRDVNERALDFLGSVSSPTRARCRYRQGDMAGALEDFVAASIASRDPQEFFYWKLWIASMTASVDRLLDAAETNDESQLRLMLEHGADINARNSDGDTGLHRAARAGAMSSLKLLIDRGANLEATNGYGQTPIFLATSRRAAFDFLVGAGA
ncbi:MAG TPA: hypothetical protein DCE44_21390, partial [Verrucomicrobiales bacterium]|nr:hypothetical protein [Verrucomicrobiales bacterium]